MAWNGSNQSSQSANQSISRKSDKPKNLPHGLLAGLIIIALGGSAVWWFAGRGRSPSAPSVDVDRRVPRIAEVMPAIATNRTPDVKSPTEERSFETAVKAPNPDALAPGEIAPGVNTNGWIVVPSEKPEVEFSSMYEQQLCWLFTTEPGDDPPPLLPIEECDHNDLARILVSQLKIREKDSDDAANAKEAVNLGKKEAIRYLKEGGDPEEFISAYHKLLSEAHDKWVKATDSIRMAVQDGNDPEVVKEFIKRTNAELVNEGIKAADIPMGFKQRYMNEE